ncbi:MAG: thioredoxin, partial [Treponema sp.]|jgi:thioredoxin 1|nr:thioredoxin [Treponema sp.]
MSKEITVTAANFDSEVAASSVPVLLDFWAPWCRPCKTIAPFIEQIAGEYEGRLKVGKINVDEESDLAVKHNVSSIPTLAVYKNGEMALIQSGALPRADIERLVAPYL